MLDLYSNLRCQQAKLKGILQAWTTRSSYQAYTSENGLKILVRGSHPDLDTSIKLWFASEKLASTLLSKDQLKGWSPDIILSSSFGRRAKLQRNGLVVDVRGEYHPLRTQPYVEMEVPLRQDFDRFLMEVMPKKRRAYIRKSLNLPYRVETTRNERKLGAFLHEILEPVTDRKHGPKSKQLSLSDILEKGDKWQVQLIYDDADRMIGGNLLLHSRVQKQLRLWRQAVHPTIIETKEAQSLLFLLNSLPLKLGCELSYKSVSFGVSPHFLADSNFYSKRLWACAPSWNGQLPWIDIATPSERGRQFVEHMGILCMRCGASRPDAVLIPRLNLSPSKRDELLEWLNQYGHSELSYVATLHKGLLRYQTIASLTPLVPTSESRDLHSH